MTIEQKIRKGIEAELWLYGKKRKSKYTEGIIRGLEIALEVVKYFGTSVTYITPPGATNEIKEGIV